MKVDNNPDDYLGDVMGDINSRLERLRNGRNFWRTNHTLIVPLSEMFGYATIFDQDSGPGGILNGTIAYEPVPKSIQEKLIDGKGTNA